MPFRSRGRSSATITVGHSNKKNASSDFIATSLLVGERYDPASDNASLAIINLAAVVVPL